MNISKALKEARKRTILNQKEFADKLGISQTYLSLLEAGKKTPSMDLIQVYSELLKTPVAIFLFKAMTDKDVHPSKKKVFNQLQPVINNLIDEFF